VSDIAGAGFGAVTGALAGGIVTYVSARGDEARRKKAALEHALRDCLVRVGKIERAIVALAGAKGTLERRDAEFWYLGHEIDELSGASQKEPDQQLVRTLRELHEAEPAYRNAISAEDLKELRTQLAERMRQLGFAVAN
jgi:hypothetical protein